MRRNGGGPVAAVVVAAIAATIGVVAPAASTAAPAEPAADPRDDRPTVAFVGDSIGRDAEEEIRDEVRPTNDVDYHHAIGAGYTQYHLPRLLAKVRPADGPDIVIAELGTGDAFWSHSVRQFERNMRRFLDAVTPHVECVVWLDQKPGGNRAYPMINERAAAFNHVVHRVVRDYDDATYLHYAAWTQLAGAPGPYFMADWLHLTKPGELELARLVANAVRGCQDEFASGPFWDVPDHFWAAEDIAWAAEQGLVAGYDNDTFRAAIGQFRPPVTRAQAAQMIWHLMGSPDVSTPHGWQDGPPWVRAALQWGRSANVFTGFSDNRFLPSRAITRGQMLGWLWRAAGRPGGFPPHTFPDGTTRLRKPLNWAEANDVVTGIRGRFERHDRVTRAQVATWLRSTWDFLHPAPSPASTPAPPTTTAAPTTAPSTTVSPTTAPPTTVSPPTTVP